MRDVHEMDTMEFRIPEILDSVRWPVPDSSLVRIDFGAATHRGKVRPINEDSYIIYKVGRYWEKLHTSLEEGEVPDQYHDIGYALVVADGIGGHEGGEVASKMAIRVCVSLVLNSARWCLKLDNPETRDREIEEAKKRMQAYFLNIDRALIQYANAYPRLLGMGTTLTGAYCSGHDLFTTHVGDSRAYIFRAGMLSRLTHDQTLAQALADSGAIKPEEVSRHYLRHSLTSCLGGEQGKVDFDVQQWRLEDGDRVLLCSDGLTEMVPEPEIAQALAAGRSSQETCQTLLDLSLKNGGKDNVTILLAHYVWPSS